MKRVTVGKTRGSGFGMKSKHGSARGSGKRVKVSRGKGH